MPLRANPTTPRAGRLGGSIIRRHQDTALRFLDLIEAKKLGRSLSPDSITWAVDAYVRGAVPDYQMSALLMAVRWRGLDDEEAAALTRAMVESGDSYQWTPAEGIPVDKHSTGGVGDKVSLVLAPLAAAAGCTVPMISGRGLGHTGGTLDKLESIPGLRTNLNEREFTRQLEKLGVAMGAQTAQLVPADRLLYALRDATATVDETGLITASILSKKIAEGARALVLDVKVGSGAFFGTLTEARRLAERLRDVAVESGLACSAIITNMDQPLGRAIGNTLEVEEALACLDGGGPPDLRSLVLELGIEMLELAGLAGSDPRKRLEELLDSGAARDRFLQLVEAQGGDPRVLERGELPRAPQAETLTVAGSGFVSGIDGRALGLAAIALRAGRDRREDTIDPAAGLMVYLRLGDRVQAGSPWVTMSYGPDADVDRARELVHSALTLSPEKPESYPLIHERLQ